MNKMNKTEKFTEKEWEELASLLSQEKVDQADILRRFTTEDKNITANEWEKLRSLSGNEEINVDNAWNSVLMKINKYSPKNDRRSSKITLWRSTLVRIAAFALIVLSLGFVAVYLNNSGYLSKKITLTTGNDQKNLEVSLPDGSKIFMNRNTILSYRANFGKAGRKVQLTGEAFFEITPDVSKPFSVYADKAKVTVVGTTFNVITNNTESAVEVYVKTGEVILSDNSGSKSIKLDPEDVGTMNSTISEKTINNNPNYMSWNTNLLVYNGQKLSIVFHDLKRAYNMDIIADDPDILNNPWTTSPINNQKPETIIRLICTSFGLSYTKDGNIYHLKKE